MKPPLLAPLGVITVTVIAALNLTSAQPDPDPALLFKGYGSTETNKTKVAKLELSNTSSRTMWLYYEGRKPALTPPFLERATAPVKPHNTNWVVSASIGNWFTEEHVLLPGQSLRLNFPLVPGKAAVQVGIEYFFSSLNDNAERPKRREVWCLQAVCHQASTSDSSPAHPEGSAGGKSG
jgi:hypothetical protein